MVKSIFKLRVRGYELDSFGHVNNAVYLQYAEEAKWHFFAETKLLGPIAGGIYVAEALSVIIQVYVFKTQNGRRFFRMAPLHHHYELGGWSEVKIVAVFCLVTALLCVIAFFGVISISGKLV